MRKIKFRALSSGKKEWIYGWYIATNETDYAWIVNYAGLAFTGEENRVEVMKESVGQYTGLKDKNGKEIYEGDIIKMLDEWIDHYTLFSNHKIEFGSGTFRLENGVSLADCLDEDSEFEKCAFEIIGNIYEHKNILDNIDVRLGK